MERGHPIEHDACPGYKIIVCDYKSIEPRVLAHFGGCKKLVNIPAGSTMRRWSS
jgi:hypothetical protein